MQNKLLLIFLCVLSFSAQAQIVNIPDTAFKQALLMHGDSISGTYIDTIDLNGDNEIQVAEALAYDGLIDVHNFNIVDLTGIEAFENIVRLRVYNNELTTLDVSNNQELVELNCRSNNLTTLDLSQNKKLVTVLCFYNDITNIQFAEDADLTGLWCHNNVIDSLDLGSCSKLLKLFCFGNQMRYLDVSVATNALQLQFQTNDLQDVLLPIVAPNMWQIVASANELVTLNLSNYPALTNVQVHGNLLSSLNVANGWNDSLEVLRTYDNPNLSCIETDYGMVPDTSFQWTKDSLTIYSTDCGYCWSDYEVDQNVLTCSYEVAIYNGVAIQTDTVIVDSLINSCGLDSVYHFIVENQVTVLSDTTILPMDSICLGDGVTFGGEVITATGTYYDYIPVLGACDSVVAKAFEVEPALLIEENQNTVYTTRDARDFQWYKDGVAIAGATDSVFVATVSGAYHLDATVGNCTYSSEAKNVLINGISNFAGSGIHIYPNPTEGMLHIKGLTEAHSLQLFDISGREVHHLDTRLQAFDLSALPKGVYFLKLKLEAGTAVEKVIVK